jgi:hypothetical protein
MRFLKLSLYANLGALTSAHSLTFDDVLLVYRLLLRSKMNDRTITFMHWWLLHLQILRERGRIPGEALPILHAGRT